MSLELKKKAHNFKSLVRRTAGSFVVRRGGFVYGLFGLEVSCFYFTAHRMVKDGVSIALRFVAGMRDAGMRGQGGRKCDGVAEESESRETLKWQKISFEKALESTRKLKNVMEEGILWA